jgi:signal transduction histidine kinase/FixJ family two-component response regulator/HPt (histidine-containing phosphotransfer) domain-containing protein
MFRFKIAFGFLLALTLAAAGVYFTYTSLNRLSETVREAVKPDERIIRLKNLIFEVSVAESAVRTFAINNDEKNLDPYYKLLSTIDTTTDTLKILFAANKNEIDSISEMLKEKIDSYDELIDLRYNSLITEALQELNSEIIIEEPLTTDTLIKEANPKKDKGFLGFFSRKKFEKKAKELDSLKLINETQEINLRRRVKKIREEQNARMAAMALQEVQLLEKDKNINTELFQKVSLLETEILSANKSKTETTIDDINKQQKILLYISIAASAFILLLSVVIFSDISRSNRYKKQLEVARNRAEQLAKFREEFLSNMSHELRTPVSALSGFSKKLERTTLSQEQQGYLKNVSFASDHLLGIINDVLDISRIESGYLKLTEAPFSIYQTVSEVAALLSIKALEKNVELITDFESIKNIHVIGDAMRLRQVLFNVLGNAIKFTNEGNVKLTVNPLRRSPDKNTQTTFQIIVNDTGIGIAPEKIKNIFIPFEQADMGIARKFGGTGLGLSIAKKIVDLHNGKIEVTSKENEGTTFTIEIPYSLVDVLHKVEPVTTKEVLHEQDKPTHVKTLIGLKILLAEDDELNRILQHSILTDLGADVDSVNNGEEVLVKLQSEKFDAVLMDLQMPQMGGLETAKKIREDLSSNIPVIAITANVHEAEKNKCIASGMNAVIIKPFTSAQIAESILQFINPTEQKIRVEEEVAVATHIIDKPYNLETLIKASNGNKDFVVRMLKLFCMSGESLFVKANTDLGANEIEKAADHIHRLIPSCRQLHLNELAASLTQLENDCREQKNSSNTLLQLNNCHLYFKEVVALLNDEINQLKKIKV